LVGAVIAGLLIYGGAMTEREWLILGSASCAVALIAWEIWHRKTRGDSG
jgi:hypothetical protein